MKNVETLIVKVFEVNTQNFYREHLTEIGPDINLDGLVANEEKTYAYHEPPLRRVRRHFEFPLLNHRGVYVVDFIGNGKASRALIRKGKLQFLVRTSVAGQIFSIFDEQNKPQPEAVLWLAGTLYSPDKDGTIAVPFSNAPGRQPLVMSLGGFSSLGHVEQQAENYHLDAAMYVDREELIGRRKAQLIVRPQLLVNGTPISRKSLDDVRLVITSTDLDNVVSTKEVPEFKLFADRETVYEFQVPQRLAKIQFTLKAKIQNYSRNQKVDLSAEQSFSINEIDRTDKTEDLHFARVGGNYVIDLLGKTGEAKADRPIQITLKMRDFTQPVNASLATDASGEVNLGALEGTVTVTASSPQGVSHTWTLRTMSTLIQTRSKARRRLRSKCPTWAIAKNPIARSFRYWNCAASSSWPTGSRIFRSRTASCRWKNFRPAIIRCCSSKMAGRFMCGLPKGNAAALM